MASNPPAQAGDAAPSRASTAFYESYTEDGLPAPLPSIYAPQQKRLRVPKDHGDELLNKIEGWLVADGPDVDTFPIKLPDSIDLHDIKTLQRAVRDKLAPARRTPTQRLQASLSRRSTANMASTSRVYGTGQSSRDRAPPSPRSNTDSGDEWGLLSDGDRPRGSVASTAASIPDVNAVETDAAQRARGGDGDVRTTARLDDRDWVGEAAADAATRVPAPAPAPMRRARQSINMATSSLAMAEGGSAAGLIGARGMVGPAEWDGDAAIRPPSRPNAAPRVFNGAVTRHNPLRGLFDEPRSNQDTGATAFTADNPDPYLGAGAAAGYAVGHEAELARRGARAYGAVLATAKVRGMQVHMYADDSDGSDDSAVAGRSPAPRLRDRYLQTGHGLEPYNANVGELGSSGRAAAARSLAPPRADSTAGVSVVAPALRQMTLAGATPLAADPRAGMFRASAAITALPGNRTRRRKLDAAAARLGLRRSDATGGHAGARKRASAPAVAAADMPYSTGGARGLGAGLRSRAPRTGRMRDTLLDDGSVLTGDAMQRAMQQLESGATVRRLRAQLEDARANMAASSNMLHLRKQDWAAAVDAAVAQAQEMDMTVTQPRQRAR